MEYLRRVLTRLAKFRALSVRFGKYRIVRKGRLVSSKGDEGKNFAVALLG